MQSKQPGVIAIQYVQYGILYNIIITGNKHKVIKIIKLQVLYNIRSVCNG